MAWSCTPGRFEWHYAVDETVHIISGEVLVTDENGKIHRLGPGDMAFFPAGSHSVWQVTKTVRKLAVCRHSLPRPFGFVLRAWNKLFHRLTASRPAAAWARARCQAPAVGKSPRRRPCARKSTGALCGLHRPLLPRIAAKKRRSNDARFVPKATAYSITCWRHRPTNRLSALRVRRRLSGEAVSDLIARWKATGRLL